MIYYLCFVHRITTVVYAHKLLRRYYYRIDHRIMMYSLFQYRKLNMPRSVYFGCDVHSAFMVYVIDFYFKLTWLTPCDETSTAAGFQQYPSTTIQ